MTERRFYIPPLKGMNRETYQVYRDSYLSGLQRIPGVNYGLQSPAHAFENIPDFLRGHEARTVIVFGGDPGSGKSRDKRYAKDYVNLWTPQIHGRYRYFLSEVEYEVEGERAARRAGLVKTPHDKPFTPEELMAIDKRARVGATSAIKNSAVSVLEFPFLQADHIDGQWVGRVYGSAMMQALVEKSEEFKTLPDYNVLFFITIASAQMHDFNLAFRKRLKSARTIQEREQVLKDYGREIPDSSDVKYIRKAYSDMRNEGASEEQINVMDQQARALRERLIKRGEMRPIPDDLVHHVYEVEVKNDVEEWGLNEERMLRLTREMLEKGAFSQHIFEHRYGEQVDPNNVTIYHNNKRLRHLVPPGANIAIVRQDLQSLGLAA